MLNVLMKGRITGLLNRDFENVRKMDDMNWFPVSSTNLLKRNLRIWPSRFLSFFVVDEFTEKECYQCFYLGLLIILKLSLN